MALIRRLVDRLVTAPAPAEPAGLAFGALYPTLAPELRLRSYQGVRIAASSTSPAILAPANPARRSLSIVNDGTAVLYLAEAPTVSSSSYSVRLDAGQTYVTEGPDVYRGDVAGVWSSANGAARISEATG